MEPVVLDRGGRRPVRLLRVRHLGYVVAEVTSADEATAVLERAGVLALMVPAEHQETSH
ncbi:hypothetical protein AB0M47_20885 [Hamadaea sp. NPDC051192]|uniref:hypothetical protein n=1 Tax=Hamadaea sp. NPDC051192 TaxID=3154940 RepID=UPI00341477E5